VNGFTFTSAKPAAPTDSPIVEAQLEAALDAWEDLPPTPLQECPVCGKIGLPERIQQHQCGERFC